MITVGVYTYPFSLHSTCITVLYLSLNTVLFHVTPTLVIERKWQVPTEKNITSAYPAMVVTVEFSYLPVCFVIIIINRDIMYIPYGMMLHSNTHEITSYVWVWLGNLTFRLTHPLLYCFEHVGNACIK